MRDVLGLCQFSWQTGQKVRCQALPQLDAIKQLPLLRSLTAEDGIPNPSGQPEVTGWKLGLMRRVIQLRTSCGRFMPEADSLTKLPEHSVFHSKRTLAFLLTSENDEAAAAVARVALQSGALGEDWAFGADGYEKPISEYAEALSAIADREG